MPSAESISFYLFIPESNCKKAFPVTAVKYNKLK